MAEDSKPRRRIRQTETVRDRTRRGAVQPKTRRIRSAADSASERVSNARALGRREYHPIKLPDNRLGRWLTKSRRLTPRFFREAWQELKLVTWPNRRETTQLTAAVLVFAFLFGALVAGTDYVLERLFRQLLDL